MSSIFFLYLQVKYDEDRRYPRMEHILQAVRCQYLTPSFLKEQMSTCTVLKKVPACREYLAKIFKVGSLYLLRYFLIHYKFCLIKKYNISRKHRKVLY